MKTRYLMMNWLILVLGIAVAVAGLVAGTSYLELEQKIQANEALIATLDRLGQGHQLSVALKMIHDGEVDKAAQYLDLFLCGHILRADSELASADAQTRTIVEDAFRRIARVRPKTADGAAAGSTHKCNQGMAAAQRILEQASAGDYTAGTK